MDHRTLFRWVQQTGATIVAHEDAQQTAVFLDGELPVGDPTPREIIVAEVDGTFLHAKSERGLFRNRSTVGGIMTAMPIDLLFLAAQRYYVQGVPGVGNQWLGEPGLLRCGSTHRLDP